MVARSLFRIRLIADLACAKLYLPCQRHKISLSSGQTKMREHLRSPFLSRLPVSDSLDEYVLSILARSDRRDRCRSDWRSPSSDGAFCVLRLKLPRRARHSE